MLLNARYSKDRTDIHESAAHTNPVSALPKRLKRSHTRQRSNSWGGATDIDSGTYYSSTIVPASAASLTNEALSSLVNSLTSISEAQRQSTPKARPRAVTGKQDVGAERIISASRNPDPNRESQDHTDKSPVDDDDDDEAYCPPPIAGYSTINAPKVSARPRTAGSDKSLRKFKSKLQTSQPRDRSAVKSQRDLQSPDPIASIRQPRLSCGNDSVTSLPLSTSSKLSRSKSPFKMFFSSRLGREHAHMEPTLSNAQSFETARSSPEKDQEKDTHRFSAFVTVGRISTDVERKESDTRTLSSLSPSHRTDLNESLIPSRRSSLRSRPRRASKGSKDLKSLNIDQDLIEENHETVQRIRELQQAREKRHSEWRQEARKSEKPAKRMSMPHRSSSPLRPSPSVRSSWHAKAVESPNAGGSQFLSATVTGTDLQNMPAFVEVAENEPLTPIEQDKPLQQDSGLRRNSSVTPSTTTVSSAKRHKKRLSDSLRRVSMMRSPIIEDANDIEDDVEAFLNSPRFTQKIRHPRTGRTIAFSEVGDPHGSVVFCCVGMGLTRYVTSFYDEIAKAQKLRIITPDRPGVGETDAMSAERSTPLAWVDDVAVICTSLGIEKFSLLAHSAGAIYALAAALKMPQYVRGRIHLLAPWIPASQLSASGQYGAVRAANLPTSHKILSFLPASFMKAANSRFLSATSASIEPRTRKDRKKDGLSAADLALDAEMFSHEASLSSADIAHSHNSMLPTPESLPPENTRALQDPNQNISCYQAEQVLRSPPRSPTPGAPQRSSTLSIAPTTNSGTRTPSHPTQRTVLTLQARQKLYDTNLTHRTWALATLNANPAVDLIICLERKRPIGFRYTDITRAVVVHHGGNDTRVPLENVQWLSTAMRRCELRILEDEGHGLMASANVMSNVLGEIGREWEEWIKVHGEKEKRRKEMEVVEAEQAKERERGMRRGYPKW